MASSRRPHSPVELSRRIRHTAPRATGAPGGIGTDEKGKKKKVLLRATGTCYFCPGIGGRNARVPLDVNSFVGGCV